MVKTAKEIINREKKIKKKKSEQENQKSIMGQENFIICTTKVLEH